jgi:hypothetical protein
MRTQGLSMAAAAPIHPPFESSNKALAGAGTQSAVKTPPHVSSVNASPRATANHVATSDADAVAMPAVDGTASASPFPSAAVKASPAAKGAAQVPAPLRPPGHASASANDSERTSLEKGQEVGGALQGEVLRASSLESTSTASTQSSAVAGGSAAGGAKKKHGGKKRGGRGKGSTGKR